MAEEISSLHIDTDWKKQAQEEKRKLAEQEAKKAQQPIASPSPPMGASVADTGATGSGRAGRGRDDRDMPPATLSTLIQSIMTQVLFYLGEIGMRGGGSNVNLDMAKHNVDLLGMLEEKTKGNLTPEEKELLDTALYETRMRYVSVASQYIG